MKLSRYNFIYQNYDESWLVYNSRKNSLVVVDDEIRGYLDNFSKNNSNPIQEESINELVECGVLVDKELDELAEIQEKDIQSFCKMKSLDNYIHITICPTYSCNFRCTYCYEQTDEKEVKSGIIDQITLDKILKIYQKHCEEQPSNNSVRDSIHWLGGEPLLNTKLIEYFQEKIIALAKKYNRNIEFGITTNGFLFTKERQELLKKYHIDKVQISIDGTPDIHNKRRYYPVEPSKNFSTIMENIRMADNFFKLSIRINVDEENYHCLDKLLEQFAKERIWPDRNIHIYISNVEKFETDRSKYALGRLQFEQIERDFKLKKMEIYNRIKGEGKAKIRLQYPTIKKGGCIYNLNKNAVIIDAWGDFYSCWHHVKDHKFKIGSIDDQVSENHFPEKLFKELSEYRELIGCNQCKYLPICTLTCADSLVRTNEVNHELLCTKWKYVLKDTLLYNYQLSKEKPEVIRK